MYELLELGRSRFNVDIMEMLKTERNYIIQKCIEEPVQQIVITHGTDTMVETANMLAQL